MVLSHPVTYSSRHTIFNSSKLSVPILHSRADAPEAAFQVQGLVILFLLAQIRTLALAQHLHFEIRDIGRDGLNSGS